MGTRAYLRELTARREITRSLTWKLAAPLHRVEKCIRKAIGKGQPPRIPELLPNTLLAWVKGGLGDHLIAAAFLERLKEELQCPVAVLSERAEIASLLWRGAYLGSPQILPYLRPDLEAMECSALPRPLMGHACPAFLKEALGRDQVDSLLLGEDPWLDGLAAKKAVLRGLDRYSVYQDITGIPFSQDCRHPIPLAPTDLAIFERHALSRHGYITVGGGVDEVFHPANGPRLTTKQLSAACWTEVLSAVREACPGIPLVRLGTSPLAIPADLDLNGQTSLSQLGWLLKESLFHIDVEGGLVHLAHHLGTPSLVFFGPTPAGFFGYRENVNLHNGACTDCYWLSAQWMSQCVRGLEQPPCTAAYALAAVRNGARLLRKKRKPASF